jgi:pimeloyl-ACP methyl ester carboxylesterase
MERARVGDIRLNYVRRGEGRDVVMLHGLGADLSFWFLGVLPALARSFAVTAYDLRGHGRSDMPESGYTTADMARDLGGLLDLLGIGRADLVGHSFGGAVVLQFAAQAPERVRSLVLADAFVPGLVRPRRLKEWSEWPAYRRRLEGAGVDGERVIGPNLLEVLAGPAGRRLPRTRGDAPFVPFAGSSGRRSAADRWLRLVSDTSAADDLTRADAHEALGGVAMPALAMFGERSPCLDTMHALERTLPNCETRIVPALGHFHPIRDPAGFATIVRDFLQRQTA